MAKYGCFVRGVVTPIDLPSQCSSTGYIVESALNYSPSPTLQDIFAVPLVGDLQTMWLLGFGLPMTAYFTAFAYGVLLNFLEERNH